MTTSVNREHPATQALHDAQGAVANAAEATGQAAEAVKPVAERVWDTGSRMVSIVTSIGLMGTLAYVASIASQIGAVRISAYASSIGAVEAARSLGAFAYAAATANSFLLPIATPLFMVALVGIAFQGVKGIVNATEGFNKGFETGFVRA